MEVVFDYDPAKAPDADARARERAENLLAHYQQVLGHELPNLLVAVQGLARLVAEENVSRLDADGRSMLERLAELTRRADALVRSTAAVGRVCRRATLPESVALGDAVREAVAAVKSLCNGAAVEYDVSTEMPVLAVSRPALHQVLVELLATAARSALPGRPVKVSVSARHGPRGAELRIAHDGRGLPPESLRRCGEPGAELFVVRELVAGWGGALRVCSEPAGGTAVTVTFRDPQLARASTESGPHSS